ncbi:unnamed protein product [Lathyrus sativus]|nr:unnamed protein product [Lathyrus sativus]
MSRIDRFLLSESLAESWKIVGQVVGVRDIFDHSPIWLKSCTVDWSPKPFIFNNNWFSHKDFYLFVKVKWNGFVVSGRGDFVLKEKLRMLKRKLRSWNAEVFGWVNLKIDKAVESGFF